MKTNRMKIVLSFVFACIHVSQSYTQIFPSDYYSDSLETSRIERKLEKLSCHDKLSFSTSISINTLKRFYSEKILLPFEKDPEVDILNIINQIERCENLSFPKQVATILKGRFRDLTKEKYYGITSK